MINNPQIGLEHKEGLLESNKTMKKKLTLHCMMLSMQISFISIKFLKIGDNISHVSINYRVCEFYNHYRRKD